MGRRSEVWWLDRVLVSVTRTMIVLEWMGYRYRAGRTRGGSLVFDLTGRMRTPIRLRRMGGTYGLVGMWDLKRAGVCAL